MVRGPLRDAQRSVYEKHNAPRIPLSYGGGRDIRHDMSLLPGPKATVQHHLMSCYVHIHFSLRTSSAAIYAP